MTEDSKQSVTINQQTTVADPAHQASPLTPTDMLRMALDSGADLTKLEKFMELEQAWKRELARIEFFKAGARFREKALTIQRTSTVQYETSSGGYTDFKYAKLGDILDVANKPLGKAGLTFRWTVDQEGDNITVTCILSHVMGHSESCTLTAKADTSGKKNPIQALASSVAYLERYTFMAVTGLATVDADDDGAGADIELVTAEQAAEIYRMIEASEKDATRFFNWLSAVTKVPITKASDVPAIAFKTCVDSLPPATE